MINIQIKLDQFIANYTGQNEKQLKLDEDEK